MSIQVHGLRRHVRSGLLRIGVAALFSATAVALAPTAPAEDAHAAPIQGVDSMWVWQSRPAARLAREAASLDVDRVFLFVGTRDPATDRRIRRSVTDLHAEGVTVEALGGAPGWTLHHRPALTWARRALGLAPFDGLHLDVEPHALRGWRHHAPRLAAHYLGLLDELGALAGPLEVDVQFAYGRVLLDDGSDFADDILERVDAVTVMSYRDTADGRNGMIAISQDWLQRATAADRRIWLAAETNAERDCPYCTFFEEGQTDMASVLSQVDAVERTAAPTYQGIAIEDLDGWLALGP